MSDEAETREDFGAAVNMTVGQLEKWLATAESKEVGDKSDGESTGHASGRRTVKLLQTKQADLTGDDYGHMRKVVGYVHRHLAQRPDQPESEIESSRWRHSLMNWGHDPLKS